MKTPITQFGIDTFCWYHSLTAKQAQDIKDGLKQRPGYIIEQEDYFSETARYVSNCFTDLGIRIIVSRRRKTPWGLYVIVHPMLLLGDYDRSALYQPSKRNCKKVFKRADTLLEEVGVPYSVEKMKLHRVDVTCNLVFAESEMVDTYLRILKKGLLIPRYRLVWFRKDENKAKDCKAANQHSYKQQCKSAAFFAYDKTAQLKMYERFPESLIGKKVLRLECQLRRRAMEKWCGKKAMGDTASILCVLKKRASKIIRWYLSRMLLSGGKHVRYKAAEKLIKEDVKNKKTRERMLYLLRKTSDSRDLEAAVKKMAEKFRLKNGQVRHVLRKFRKLGISSITLPNNSEREGAIPIAEYLK